MHNTTSRGVLGVRQLLDWLTMALRPYHNHIIPYHTMKYHPLPYHTIPYHDNYHIPGTTKHVGFEDIAYHTIPYHTVPCNSMVCYHMPYNINTTPHQTTLPVSQRLTTASRPLAVTMKRACIMPYSMNIYCHTITRHAIP